MDKKFADKMIGNFQQKFFGFALQKCNSLEEAEELAARITYEAYITLRTVDEVYNWDGYLYRIATNVYVRYVKEQMKHRNNDVDKEPVRFDDDIENKYVAKEELAILKREVAWLSKRHREIVVLHYYHNKKMSEIALRLGIPEGTVKWHLSDAKVQLKKGMKQMRIEGKLGIDPIKLVHMGNIGSVGDMGDTVDFLNSKLRQNIAYAAYFEPKTIEEISQELGVSPVYVEDEVEYLEEYGFLDLLPGKKYRTNVFIECVLYHELLKIREIDKEIARVICDEFVPKVVKMSQEIDKTKIYIPDDDINYYLWTAIVYNVLENGVETFDWDAVRRKNYMVKRKDGGDFIAIAKLYQREVEETFFLHESVCGPMYVGKSEEGVASWSVSSTFDDRKNGWEDNQMSDYRTFYMFINGKLPKTEAVLDKYIRLYDRGLLVNKDGVDKVNVILVKDNVKEWIKVDEEYDAEMATIQFLNKMRQGIVPFSQELRDKINELNDKKIQLEKQYYPKHMQPLLEIIRKTRQINIVMVLDELLKREVLKPLSKEQKKGVMVMMFCNDTIL